MSARDRAATILALANPESRPEHFRKPGHIFPLRYREGGVLKRAGHTEASIDLACMAGLPPIGVLCEIVDDRDGSMARLPWLSEFASKHKLPIISIADLVRCVVVGNPRCQKCFVAFEVYYLLASKSLTMATDINGSVRSS